MSLEKYSIENAESEAALLQELMAHNKGLSYSEAHDILTQWTRLKEESENGTVARSIRSLDLSTSEGVEKLKEYLEPYGNYGVFHKYAPLNKKVIRILDDDGKSIFRSGNDPGTYEYFGHEYYVEHMLRELIETVKLDKEKKWYQKFGLYGHFYTTIPVECIPGLIEAPESEKGFYEAAADSPLGSDKFLITLASMGELVAFSVNGGYPGWFLYKWGGRINSGAISEEFAESHPNSESIRKMLSKADDFFRILREVLMKFLSNQIQNSDYVMPHDSTKIRLEEVISDANSGEKYPRAFGDITKTLDAEALIPELSVMVKEQTDMFIEKIDRYKAALDEYNSKMSYAKPLR